MICKIFMQNSLLMPYLLLMINSLGHRKFPMSITECDAEI